MSSLRAYAPASIGNFAAGFDLLGAALAPRDGSLLGDLVEVHPAEADSLEILGPYAATLPGPPEDNLVLRTARLYAEALRSRGLEAGPARFVLHKNLPVNSGLGSSASSIVAALTALQAAAGEPLARNEVLDLAGRAEGIFSGGVHLDNVAPSLAGGLQLIVPGRRPGQPLASRSLPWFEDLQVVVVHPDFELPTARSRAVLPPAVPLGKTVAWGQNLAALVHALHTRDRALLALSLRDLLVEPHRAGLVPGFPEAKARALAEGAFGASLSGSGPSAFAVAGEDRAEAVQGSMQAAFRGHGLESHAWICHLDALGARIL
ncbi:MAG: homoserine kinase [Acidobacteria bacterium]|nr:homoserine kinase [Acidobacteriota bacterium]